MKDTLSGTDATASFTPTSDFDAIISGSFVGTVRLERQLAGESAWDPVPNSEVVTKNQYSVTINSTDVLYRFTSVLTSGSAIVFASGV